MKPILTGRKIIGPFVLFAAGFCSCVSTEVQKSSAEKEREVRYRGSFDERESIPLTEYFPIFRVPEYSELSVAI